MQLSLPNQLKSDVKSRMNVVGATLTGNAPTTFDWSTISSPTKVRIILGLAIFINFICNSICNTCNYRVIAECHDLFPPIILKSVANRMRVHKYLDILFLAICVGNSWKNCGWSHKRWRMRSIMSSLLYFMLWMTKSSTIITHNMRNYDREKLLFCITCFNASQYASV